MDKNRKTIEEKVNSVDPSTIQQYMPETNNPGPISYETQTYEKPEIYS
jgi:hypothetical protein